MKLKNILALGAALALAALSPAYAAGYYTPAFPQVTAANIQTNFNIPVDTNYAGGAAPQTAYVTSGDLKTYANGGAIVTATGSAGASTANGERFVITTEALTTAAAAVFTETVTNSSVTASSLVLCSVGLGTNTTGSPALTTVTPASGSVVVKIQNVAGAAALNGTLTIGCRVSN